MNDALVRLLVVLLVVAIGFVLVSRFVAEATIRMIFQIVLALVLIWAILHFVGVGV